MKHDRTFKLRIERPLLVEMYDATAAEKDKREPRWRSVAGMIRFAVGRMLRKGKR